MSQKFTLEVGEPKLLKGLHLDEWVEVMYCGMPGDDRFALSFTQCYDVRMGVPGRRSNPEEVYFPMSTYSARCRDFDVGVLAVEPGYIYLESNR